MDNSKLDKSREALAKLRAMPNERIRIGQFWYGDDAHAGAIFIRQATKAQYKALAAVEGKPADEIAKANKATVTACVLWYPGAPTELKEGEDLAARFLAWMDDLEELYPVIWSELITAWDEHNHGARADLRGKA